jgi:hypothetical protein
MKLAWGKKISCPACSKPFYDLQKPAPMCPNCGHSIVAGDKHSKKLQSGQDLAEEEKVDFTDITFEFEEESADQIPESSAEILTQEVEE